MKHPKMKWYDWVIVVIDIIGFGILIGWPIWYGLSNLHCFGSCQ